MAKPVTLDCPGAQPDYPALAIEPDPSSGEWFVSVCNLEPHIVGALGDRLKSLIHVKVADAEGMDGEDLPDLSGDVAVRGGRVCFLPHFPFDPGVRFLAVLDLGVLKRCARRVVLTHEFSIPREAASAEPEVSQVFPSANVLPENLLRFYVRFSNPMRRGRAENNIELLGPDGRPAPDVLYRAPVELWDNSMKCLTILLDPGRLKRGVGPNRMLGPPLEAGRRYTLVVGASMTDVYGHRLRERFSKSFIVSQPIREPVSVAGWKITAPPADGHESLEVIFSRPLDWAQLWHGITVVSKDGERASGKVDVDEGESRWRFTPDTPWRMGHYSVRASPDLEDICGNTHYGPFDGPLRSADELALEKAVRSIPFEVEPIH
jgi:hypothetical protein